MSQKTVLCSAGMSHLLLYPNGDVYRCMADYNARRAPLFNAKQGWKTLDTPLECPHDTCYAACDLDWAKKWIFEKGDPVPETIQPQSYTVNPTDADLHSWAEQALDRPLTNMAHIVWAPSLLCNYDCRYCGCAVGAHEIHKDFLSASPELSVGEWIGVWKEILGQYDFGVVSMTGGEPLLSRATLPVLKLLSDQFRVSITTNLSTNVFGLVRDLPQPRGGRTGLKLIVASLHLTAKAFDKDVFLAKVLYLKNNGISTMINFVGHPLQLFLAGDYQQWCKNHDVPFVLSPWYGRDNDGNEAVYTEAERTYLDRIAPVNRKSHTQLHFRSYRYLIKMETSRMSAASGESITIKGKIQNTGNGSWSNETADTNQAFAIGAMLYPAGDTRKWLRHFKYPLSRSEVLPHEECDIEVECATQGLSRGVYVLKVGLIKEDELWFENKGNEPATVDIELGLHNYPEDASVSCELLDAAVPAECERDTIYASRVTVRNTGSVEWFSKRYDEDIQLGCRIYQKVFEFSDITLRDMRAFPTTPIMPGETLEAVMTLDFRNLPSGRYSLVFDMVNERKYWFRDKGSKPLIKEIRIV
jgi:hypothetical protein